LFIRVQLYLSVYGCSPSLFFDKKNRDIYSTSGLLGMSHCQYTAALQALGKSLSMHCDNSGNWMPPMEHDRHLAGVLEHVRRTSANIGFVPRVTIPSIDDDLLRLRSTKVSLFGLQHTNNPKKGLGVVHHGIVSICTGLCLGGHIASRGESTKDCIQILLQSLSGASVDSRTVVRNLCAWDRGYGGAGGAINEMALGYK
jgi:hypothetical protein